LVVGTIDPRRDKEQNLAAGTCRQFAFKEITDDRDGSQAGSPLTSDAFRISKDASHYRRTAIWYQHFTLHPLRVNAWDSPDGDAGVNGVVLYGDSKYHCTNVSDLWGD
jgi:hypothetical protein